MDWIDFIKHYVKYLFSSCTLPDDNKGKQWNANIVTVHITVLFLAHDTLSTSSTLNTVETDPFRQTSFSAIQTILHAQSKQITKLYPPLYKHRPSPLRLENNSCAGFHYHDLKFNPQFDLKRQNSVPIWLKFKM